MVHYIGDNLQHPGTHTATEKPMIHRERVLAALEHREFVFQQVHNILADIPPANTRAMFEAVLE
jgi:uroporphyrinogen-III decarboxylase